MGIVSSGGGCVAEKTGRQGDPEESTTTHKEAVPQFVIPAKPRETGREPGSIKDLFRLYILDSGSRSPSVNSSGMTD
jgi:hypothetical protein